MAPKPVAALRDVVFQHTGRDGFVLRVPLLELFAGERVACVGPSGSGKTTLVNIMSGVTPLLEGSASVSDISFDSMSEGSRRNLRLRHIGMVFQELELIEYLSTLDNILLPAHLLRNAPLPADRDRAKALACTMGIEHVLSRPPRRLSQGERQRAALCRALLLSPVLVVCDEPTGNLDPANSQRVVDLLLDYATASGAALFMVTHNHFLLDRFDRVIEMAHLVGTRCWLEECSA